MAPRGPPGRPLGNLIRSTGCPFGESRIAKGCPRCEFRGKSSIDFNDFIFHFFQNLEGPKGVLGACSDAKEAHREVPREPIKFLFGPQGGPISKSDPRQTLGRPRAGRKRRPRAPGKTKVKDSQTLTGRRTKRFRIPHPISQISDSRSQPNEKKMQRK